MSSFTAKVARAWPTILAVIVGALTALQGDSTFITGHPQIAVLIGGLLLILANFTHSPAGQRATPNSVMGVSPK